MNLKTWFKGLSVFVLSSFVTALATMTLDPTSFNFSRAGLTKVGSAAIIIGVKAVLLYLKQSPLPGNQPARIADWTKITSVLAFCVIIPATALLSGCISSWDRTTYASLAASKALIDCAVAGYNHFDADIRHACAGDSENPTQDAAFDPQTFYLPQTREAQQAVEKARPGAGGRGGSICRVCCGQGGERSIRDGAGKTGRGDWISGPVSDVAEGSARVDGEAAGECCASGDAARSSDGNSGVAAGDLRG
jgi:hypothetical protein